MVGSASPRPLPGAVPPGVKCVSDWMIGLTMSAKKGADDVRQVAAESTESTESSASSARHNARSARHNARSALILRINTYYILSVTLDRRAVVTCELVYLQLELTTASFVNIP